MDSAGANAERWSVAVADALFVLVGLGAGVGGVLLLAQIRDYGVSPTTIGITFFTGSAGFFLAGASTGAVVHRYGTRTALLGGGILFTLAELYIATRPPFPVFVAVGLLTGYGTGLLESVLNVYLTGLPRSTARLNRLHAFFGVGALLGPLLAAWMLTFTSWPRVPLVLAVACVPLMVGVGLTFPPDVTAATGARSPGASLLPAVLRQPAVVLGSILLTVYVGLEISVGNWAYSYLVEARSSAELVAGYAVSGYWLGLTLGRFLSGPIAARLRLTQIGLMYAGILGVAVTAGLTWLLPVAGLILLGFFLGPIFPTTMAVAPRLTTPDLVPTAIGVLNAGSVVGGAALPWLAGAFFQSVGGWTLIPYAGALAVLQLLVWRRIDRRIGDPAFAL